MDCQRRDNFGDAALLRERDQTLLHRIFAAKLGKVILMSYGNPHLKRKLEGASAFVVGYEGREAGLVIREIYFDPSSACSRERPSRRRLCLYTSAISTRLVLESSGKAC